MSSETVQPLSFPAKLELALRVWRSYLLVRARMRREPLPDFVARLGKAGRLRSDRHPPARLSRAVHKSLHIGDHRPTCLVNSLILFHLLRKQGDPAELVLGVPDGKADHFAHAWVELEGTDVGPPPGRGRHLELARLR